MENKRAFTKEQSLQIKQTIYAAVPQEYHQELSILYACVNYQNYSPVKRLEETLDIKGIYHNYNFPGNMPPLEYENLMKPMRLFEVLERSSAPEQEREKKLKEHLQKAKPQCLFAIRQMYEELTELNPELKKAKIKPSQISSYVAVISGACSGFPPEDIVEFSQARSGEANDKLNEEKRNFSKLLETKTGKHRNDGGHLVENWCPSLSTRNKIIDIVDKQYPKEKPQPKMTQHSFYDSDYYRFLESRGFYND